MSKGESRKVKPLTGVSPENQTPTEGVNPVAVAFDVLRQVREDMIGADYTEEEIESVFLAMAAQILQERVSH